jgi:RNA polymerase sigma-32 factor
MKAINLPIGSIDAYIQRVQDIPLLTPEEEYRFATQYQDHGDLEAAQKLVLSHLRYVVKVARGYLGYGLAFNDLVQEGTIGLMKAVKRFDPKVGVRLVSFAVHWVKAEIHEFILRNWRIVRVATTKAQRKLFFNLRGATKRLGWNSTAEVSEIAKDLGVSVSEVQRMEERLNARDVSFDLPTDADQNEEKGRAIVPAEYLEDESNPSVLLEQNQWAQYGHDQLKAAFAKLDRRSQAILQKRWLSTEKTQTLQTLAHEHAVSVERIRQLEKAAIQKLKEVITHAS